MKTLIRQRIQSRAMTIAVVGLGYVGLPLSVEAAHAGFKVIGIDTDTQKVASLRSGISYIQDIPSETVAQLVGSGYLSATADFSVLRTADTVSICVPTPLSKTKDPDLSYVLAAIREIETYIRPGWIMVLESTTYPGTTKELLGRAVSSRGLEIGKDVFLAFSPERVDPGNKVYGTRDIPKVIGGITPTCGELAAELYRCFVNHVVLVSSASVAEMAKLLENTFRSVNIALANEMAMLCDRMGINVWEAIHAAATKPFGFMPFYPGPGTGGHCIPLDPLYLSWKAKSLNFYSRFIELASDINGNMPRYVVNRVVLALNSRGLSLSRSKILVLGVAYKRDVSDVRESPALEIIRLLIEEGAQVEYNDPHVPRIITECGLMESVPMSAAGLKRYDCVIIATDHSAYDYDGICLNAPLIVDTRNATQGCKAENVIRLGGGWRSNYARVTGTATHEAAVSLEE